MSQVTDIRTLQDIDDEASSLRSALEEIERRLASTEELDQARTRFATAETELASVRKTQRRIEGEVEGFSARITPGEKRLYDGSVRNPKELSSIQHELELLKEQRSKLEDELLEVMANLDVAETEFGAAQKALVRAEARREADSAQFGVEVKRLTAAIAAADMRRSAQQAKVLPRSLVVYEDVRNRRGGVAVARVAGGNCGGCRVGIPEAIRKRAFNPDMLAQCPNCERILYVG